jgi:hypothetical protein
MEIKQGSAFKVPVRMVLASDGSNVTGLTYADVSVYLQAQGGASTQKVLLTGSEFVEIDAANFPGAYDLLLSSGNTGTVGFLKYSVGSSLLLWLGGDCCQPRVRYLLQVGSSCWSKHLCRPGAEGCGVHCSQGRHGNCG